MSKQKVGIVICANSGIDYLDIDFPIKVIRSTLLLDNKEYQDYIDIKADEFYERVVNNPNIDLSTSQTATGKIADVYQEFKDEGFTDVISITVSGKLSGTYQGAVLAADLVDGINVTVIDSKSVSSGEIYLLEEVIKRLNKGMSVEDTVKEVLELRGNVKVYVLVDTLKYLVKNGRLSATSGFLGTLLKIKPLLYINEEGSLVPLEKIRTTVKARARLIEIIKNDISNIDSELFIAYTNNKDEALLIKEDILKDKPNTIINVVPLTPVVGTHAGPGTIGIGVIKK